jgi:hypothetical protein
MVGRPKPYDKMYNLSLEGSDCDTRRILEPRQLSIFPPVSCSGVPSPPSPPCTGGLRGVFPVPCYNSN